MGGPHPRRLPDKVVVITDFSRERGGASRLALLMARTLSSRGVPVTVFAGDLPPGDMPAGIKMAGIEGQSLLDKGGIAAAASGLWNAKALKALRRLIAEADTPGTVYHIHGFLQTLSPAVFAALRPVRRRVVIHAHDYFLACPNGAFFDYRSRSECGRTPLSLPCVGRNCDKRSAAQKAWRLIRQAIQNRLVADTLRDGRVILIHEGMQSYLARGPAIANPVTVRNPAEPFLPAPIEPARNTEFLYVGDVHAYKGVFELCAAVQASAVSLMIAGDGQDRAALEAAYPEVTFLGWQDRGGLARHAARARAVVVPTLGPEPFGLTIVEALTSGLPVILANRALLSMEVAAAGAGQTFPAGDVDGLASVLSRVAADDDLVTAMSRAAIQAAERHDKSPEAWCDEILAVHACAIGPARAESALTPD